MQKDKEEARARDKEEKESANKSHVRANTDQLVL